MSELPYQTSMRELRPHPKRLPTAWSGGSVAPLVGAVAVLLVLSGCGEGQAGEAPAFQVAEVERRHLEITTEAGGQLEPIRKVEVKSKASGEVMEVLVETGDRVEPGALLARVDPRDVRNAYDQAEAELEVAQERFAIAEAQLRRSENLLAAGVITEQEHENRNLEHANARANLVRARTSLELAEVQLNDVTIRSPMNGVVLERMVEEGTVIQSASQNVSGGTALLTIADLDRVQVRTLIDETDVGRIETGMPATVRVDAHQDRVFQGFVEKIEPQAQVESNVVMFPVIVQLDNEEGILKPGMSAEVTVLLAERTNALTLPNNAIVAFNELAPAASVLGVPEERIQISQAVFQELRRELAESRGESLPERPRVAEGEMGGEEMEELRRRMAAGELSREEIQERMQAAGMQRGEGPPMGGPGGERGMIRRDGGGAGGPGAGAREAEGRPGIVFVLEDDGSLTPRPVLLGVNDWNNSEILVGVEEGERVALIGGAQLQAQQQEASQQMRSRMGAGRVLF